MLKNNPNMHEHCSIVTNPISGKPETAFDDHATNETQLIGGFHKEPFVIAGPVFNICSYLKTSMQKFL